MAESTVYLLIWLGGLAGVAYMAVAGKRRAAVIMALGLFLLWSREVALNGGFDVVIDFVASIEFLWIAALILVLGAVWYFVESRFGAAAGKGRSASVRSSPSRRGATDSSVAD